MKEKTKNFDDVVPVVHGHWILEREPSKPLYLRFRCSVCGNDYRYIGAVDITPGAHRQAVTDMNLILWLGIWGCAMPSWTVGIVVLKV